MKSYFRLVLLSFVGLWLVSSSAGAFEIITQKDIIQGVIVTEDLIKTADNAIILFDASSSMAKPYKDSGQSRYEVAKQMLMERNTYFPDMGHQIGLYLYTPWKEIYPVQPYDRDKFGTALETLPEKANSATFLTDALKRLDKILAPLSGRTSVFIYTDGSYRTKGPGLKSPADIAESLAKKYNVCFYIISTADDIYSKDLFTRAESFNFCSRVIAFNDFVEHPLFNSEALFTVKATKHIVTLTDKRVVGIKTKNFLFDFDKSELSDAVKDRLSLLAVFLKANPLAFAAMAGHTDSVGSDGYNLMLSRDRVNSVAQYLVDDHGVNPDQLLGFWFGSLNPVADNSTRKGRMKNRRVEIVVGGL